MTKQRVQLDETLLGDFHKIINSNIELANVYFDLEDGDRDKIDDTYLNLIWDTILAGQGRKLDGNPNRSTLGPILEEALGRVKKR